MAVSVKHRETKEKIAYTGTIHKMPTILQGGGEKEGEGRKGRRGKGRKVNETRKGGEGR